jgi:hypothetical protein
LKNEELVGHRWNWKSSSAGKVLKISGALFAATTIHFLLRAERICGTGALNICQKSVFKEKWAEI